MPRGSDFWIGSACLIGDDERGGASGRVRCIGVCPVLASKQWAPEDVSKIRSWLVLRSCRRSRWTRLRDNAGLHLWKLPNQQLSSNSFRGNICVETTSSARPLIQKHLGNGEPWAFQQTGPGPRIFHRLACNWPGPPEIPRRWWQRKSAQGRPWKKEKRCTAHCLESWAQA